MSCHVMCPVMSCHVSGHVMSCHVMCPVMSCHVSGHVMSCHVMSCGDIYITSGDIFFYVELEDVTLNIFFLN